MRLIDADELYAFIKDQMEKETGAYTRGKNKAFNIVKSALHNECAIPTIEAEPVKRGRWINEVELRPELYGWVPLNSVVCSACNKSNSRETSYCPNCGAKMDLGVTNGSDQH